MTTMLEAARQVYARRALPLPVQEDGSKKPDLKGWLEFKTRRPTPKELKAWNFGKRHGLGVIAGAVSGHIEAWDFDDLDIYMAFVAAADACGLGPVVERLRTGYEDATPRGGRRWLVKYPETVTWKDTTLAARPITLPDGKPSMQTLIELPTFSILAPSNGPVHPTGDPYVRLSGSVATIAPYTEQERDALLELARSFDEKPKKAAPEPKTTTTGPGRRPGDIFNQRMTWAEVIGEYFHSPRTLSNGVTYWWRPGKTPGDGSHAATTNHAGSDLLFIFSSSTKFEAERSYSKFGAYTLLEHGGDFSAAGKELWAAGFRDPESETDASASSASSSTSTSSSSTTARPKAAPSWPKPLADPAYYGVFGKIVRTIQPQTESDPVALMLQFLVMLGSIIGRTAHFTVEADTHYLNEFLWLVGPSSKARKGTSFGYADRLFKSLDPTWTQTSGLSSGEGLIWAVRDPIWKQAKDGELVVDDPGISDKRLLVFEGEMASILRVMERAGNNVGDVMKQAWDGRTLNSLTKNSPAKATGAHISVIAHITVDELRRYLTRTEMGNGWGNRFLVVCVRRSQSLPLGGQAVDLTPFRHDINQVVTTARTMQAMGFDGPAEALWRAEYARLSADRPGLLGSMTARAEAHTRRLACLIALTDQTDQVGRKHLEAALAIWRYVFESVAYIFGDSLGHPVADAILNALKTAPDGLKRTEISKVFQGHQSAEVITEALQFLESLHLAESFLEMTAGRPIEWWRRSRGE